VLAPAPKADPAAKPASLQAVDKLEGLRRPMDALETLVGSAAVKATIKSGETIVTGGYPLDDHTRAFSFSKATLVERNGKKFVQIENRQLALDQQAVADAKLESLTTNAAHVLQNAEVWDGAEAKNVIARLSGKTVCISSSDIALGERTTMGAGSEQWEFVATPTPGQNSLDVEMRVETLTKAATSSPP
jgi:hypothetical protein